MKRLERVAVVVAWGWLVVVSPAQQAQPSGQVQASGSTSSAAKETPRRTAQTLFDRLSDEGFSLTKTVYGDDAAKPATFSFERDYLDKTTFNADFALRYFTDLDENFSRSFDSSIEASLSEQPNAAADAVRFRIGYVFVSRGAGEAIRDNNNNVMLGNDGLPHRGTFRRGLTNLNLVYEADQAFENQAALLEATYTPEAKRIGIGTPQGVGVAGVQYQWRPTLVVEPGYATKTMGHDRDVSRAGGDLVFNLLFPGIASALGFQSVVASVQDRLLYLPFVGGNKDRNLFDASLDLGVTDHTYFSVSYKIGQEAPSFKRTDKLEIGLGVRF